jgi:hypothetical protein
VVWKKKFKLVVKTMKLKISNAYVDTL